MNDGLVTPVDAAPDFSLLDLIGVPVVVLERAGRILWCNRACDALLDRPLDELREPLAWEQLLAPEQIPFVRTALENLEARRFPERFEHAFVSRRGDRRWLAWSVHPIRDARGGIRYLVATGEDLTAQRAREQMLAVVSHDLRAPLNSIRLGASVLSRALPQGDMAKARDAVETILRTLHRMNRLIEDLCDVTRIEAGHLTLRRSREAVAPLIAAAIDVVQPAAEAVPVRVTVDALDGLPEVDADGDRVVQVLMNLLGNAINFTPTGGTITISAEASGDFVRLAVRDTGPGIPDSDRPHLFDRFWQGRGADRRGLGLGLFICKALAEAHGGSIQVDSPPGAGSTFSFTLPVYRAAQLGQAAPAATTALAG